MLRKERSSKVRFLQVKVGLGLILVKGLLDFLKTKFVGIEKDLREVVLPKVSKRISHMLHNFVFVNTRYMDHALFDLTEYLFNRSHSWLMNNPIELSDPLMDSPISDNISGIHPT
jgi:hypothetical protein